MGCHGEPAPAALPAGPAWSAAELRRLQLLSARLVTGVFAGEYRSVFRGRGVEFDQVREYQPGDDVRSIDWNVTARCGRPHVKQFIEEREMTLLLVLDCSASLYCPSPVGPKSALAAEACALLALAAARSNDRVGFLSFADRVERFIPPGKGIRHAQQILASLPAGPAGAGSTDLAGALDHLGRVCRRRSTLCVVSDFRSGDFLPQLASLTHRHEVVALLLSDPSDRELPEAGLWEVADPETGARCLIDTGSKRVREAYRSLARARRDGLLACFAAAGVEYLELAGGVSPLDSLVRFFRGRRLRRLP